MDNKKAHEIIHEGILDLNGLEISCYVLRDGTRVLSTSGMQKALGVMENEPNQRSSGRLNEILTSKAVSPYLTNDEGASKYEPITCYNGDQKIIAYHAFYLPDICEAVLKARDSGVELGKRQQAVAKHAEVIVRALARVGIIALVDEATGYQYERERQELQKILSKYISEELLPWQKRFPDEFYKEIFRLNDWGYFMSGNIKIQDRPGVIGHWTKKFVYAVLPKGVLEVLLEKTPRSERGNLKQRLHQRLTKEEGIEHLNKVIVSVITLMNISENWKEFERLWNKKYGQQELTFQEQKELIEPKPKSPKGFDKKLKTALEYDPKDKGV